MRASARSDLAAARVVAKASVEFWFWIAGMIAAIVAAGEIMRRLVLAFATSPDPRFPTHYAVGAAMPFPVIMDHDHAWPFLAVFWVLLALLAVMSLLAARSLARTGARGPALLLWGATAVLAAMTTIPVTFSLDAYAYAAFGRLLGVDHVNPYLEHLASGSTLGDPVIARLTAFLGTPLPDENYGPLWTLVAGAIAAVAKNGGVAWTVWGQRAAGAAALVTAAAGVLRMLSVRRSPSEAARRSALFALHPAVLYESAAAGHNDMLMIAPAVWAFALVDDMPLAAGALAGAAFAMKYVALLFVPFVIVRAYRTRGAGAAAKVAAMALVIPVAAFIPQWPGLTAFSSLLHLRADLIMSPLWLAAMWLPDPIGTRIAATAATLAAVAVVGFSVYRYARDRRAHHIYRSIVAVLMASPLLNPWYVQWLAPAAAAAGRWSRYAWWLALIVPLRYVEDALRFPDSSAAVASRIALLECGTVAILAIPVALAWLPKLPFQRVDDDDG